MLDHDQEGSNTLKSTIPENANQPNQLPTVPKPIDIEINQQIKPRANLLILANPQTPRPVGIEPNTKEANRDDSHNKSEVQDSVPLPENNNNNLNQTKAQKWIDEEEDPRFKALKRKVVDSINHVSSDEFTGVFHEVVDKLMTVLGESDYAVLFDYKPHSSRRWAYELAKGMLPKQPKIATYEPGKASLQMHNKLMEDLVEKKGIDQFVVFDDAIYSGEQVINNTINQIFEYFRLHPPSPGRKPRIILAVPYMTNRFLEAIKRNVQFGIIVPLNVRPLPTLMESLSEDEFAMTDERGGCLDSEYDPNEVITAGETLTFFDHRIPDNFSFNQNCAKLTNKGEVPYRTTATQYYRQEETDFQKYKEQYY